MQRKTASRPFCRKITCFWRKKWRPDECASVFLVGLCAFNVVQERSSSASGGSAKLTSAPTAVKDSFPAPSCGMLRCIDTLEKLSLPTSLTSSQLCDCDVVTIHDDDVVTIHDDRVQQVAGP